MNKWKLITKKYDDNKPDHIRSEKYPYKVCDFNGIQNDDNKMNRAREIVMLQNHLADNIERMQVLSNIIRDEMSYGKYDSMAAELDSYIGELRDIIDNESKDV